MCMNNLIKIHSYDIKVWTYSVDEYLGEVEGLDEGSFGRQLSPQEEALANEARAEIAKVIENNLVRV